ncbi:MAG: FHA domain-containing protein [Eubacteriales bacterium]|nr:FHA domain-containing protein [Eubacteriales bacterium]
MNGHFRSLRLLVLSFLLVISMQCVCSAEESVTETVKPFRDSIVRVESICWNGSDKIYAKKSFSGVVISADTSGNVYLLTVNKNLSFTQEEKEKLRVANGLEERDRVEDKIEVIFGGDIREKASVIGESAQRNLTILKPDKAVKFEHIPKLETKRVGAGEKISLLSFPLQMEQDGTPYSGVHVPVLEGVAGDSYLQDNIMYFRHNLATDEGAFGGLLLNASGNMIGVLQTSANENRAGAAISTEAIRDFLKTYNVGWQDYEKEVKKRKVPVLNVILGIILLVLASLNVRSAISNRKLMKGTSGDDIVPELSQGFGKYAPLGGNGAYDTGMRRAFLEYPAENRQVQITKPNFLIGRMGTCDLVLSNASGASRKHAMIEYDHDNYYVTDMNSTNHTYVNGSCLRSGQRMELKDGDEITAGHENMVFHLG